MAAGSEDTYTSAFLAQTQQARSPFASWDGTDLSHVPGIPMRLLDSRASMASTSSIMPDGSICSRRSSYAGTGAFGASILEPLPTHSAPRSPKPDNSGAAPGPIRGGEPHADITAALQQLPMQRPRPAAAASPLPHFGATPPTLITPTAAYFQSNPVEELIANYNMSKVIHLHVQQKKAWHAQQLQRLNEVRDSMVAAQAACYQSVDALGLLSTAGPRHHPRDVPAALSARPSDGAPSHHSSHRGSPTPTRPNTAPEGWQGDDAGPVAAQLEEMATYPEGAYLTFPDSSFGAARPLKCVPERGTLFERYGPDTSPASLVQSFYLRPPAARSAAVSILQREAAAEAAARQARAAAGPPSPARALPNGVPRLRLDRQRATHEQGLGRAHAKKMQARASQSGAWEGQMPPAVTFTQTTTVTMIGEHGAAHAPEGYYYAADEQQGRSGGVQAALAAEQQALEAAAIAAAAAAEEADAPSPAHGRRAGGRAAPAPLPDVRRSAEAGDAGQEAWLAGAPVSPTPAAELPPLTGAVEAGPQAVKALLDNSFFESLKEHFKETSPLVEQTWKLRSTLNANLPGIVRQIQGVKGLPDKGRRRAAGAR